MKLEDQLPAALDKIAESMSVDDPGRFEPDRPTTSRRHTDRRRYLVPAAAVVALVAIGGLFVAADRAEPEPVRQTPTATQTLPPVSTEALGPLTALRLPDSSPMQSVYVSEGIPKGNTVRWYAAKGATPDSGTYFDVVALDFELDDGLADECFLNEPFRSITLGDGTTACIDDIASDTARPVISVNRPPVTVWIGGNATEAELVAAAENLVESTTGSGFEIAPAGLPDAVQSIGTGMSVSDFATTTADDGADATSVIWSTGDLVSIFYLGVAEDVPDLLTPRLGFETIEDITVRGVPGFLRTLADQPDYLGVVWHEAGVTFQVGSQQVSRTGLLGYVEQLERPTQSDWTAMLESTPVPEEMEEEQMIEEAVTTTTITAG